LGNPAAYANLGAPGGPEFFGVINDPAIDEPVAEQIVLNAYMIVDEVTGGSLWPATYLVDEQTLTPETGEHPISQSWKPYWNMNNGPYHIYIDLGAEYFLTTIALHDMHDTKNLEVSIGEPGNWQPLFTESCDKYKTWKEHDVSVATQYVRLSMTESVFAAVNELVLYGYRITQPESVQIALNAEMMVDEVEGGSYWSADYLVDEQNLTPETEEHPTSQSWKPFWNMDKGPYHVYIDLGKEYTITEIALHDMHNTKNLDVSVGEPGNWDVLFTESCDKYISWKQHETNVKTRYVRLSMNESVFAAVNEIVLYGYSDEGEIIAEKSAGINSVINTETVTSIADVIESSLQDLFIRQNPVRNSLKLNVPDLLSTNFTIEIFSLNGARLFSQNYTYSPTAQLSIDISESCIKNGVYLMRYLNESGTTKCLKFVKNDY
jgi:mRNA-degrading endonuclease YafQ of YafQ-DinJ toxin-antitoxin module